MSGIEIVGLVAGVIGILDVAATAYTNIQNIAGLPKAFQAVARKLPLVKQTLQTIENHLENASEPSIEAIIPVVRACKEKAEKLRAILEKLDPKDSTWKPERYVTIIKFWGKKGRVEELMKRILEDVQYLAADQTMKAATADQLEGIAAAIEELALIEPSAPDMLFDRPKDIAITHDGTGSQNNVLGDSYTTQSGPGPMFGDLRGANLHISAPLSDEHHNLRSKLLRSLYIVPYKDHKDRNPDRVEGTCEWFTTHHVFIGWCQSQGSNLLWVSADPGCGKSVLMKYLVDDVLLNPDSRVICYFFFKDDSADQKSLTSALCCILRQIFVQKPAFLTKTIIDKFTEGGEQLLSSFRELWDILNSVASSNDSHKIVCILDALDECEECGRSQLINELARTYGSGTKTLPFKLLVSSRPYASIQREFQPLTHRNPVIHLSGESQVEVDKISTEIDRVIGHRVKDLGARLGLLPDEQERLQNSITRFQNRTYLWATLIFDILKSSTETSEYFLQKIISEIPGTVDEAYEKILNRSSDFVKARRLLHIVVASSRPLSLEEMAVALSTTENCRFGTGLEPEPMKRFQVTIRNLCGLFITIQNGNIYFIHQTAREFLIGKKHPVLQGTPRNHDASPPWKTSFLPGDSHRFLAEICITYLISTLENAPLADKQTIKEYTSIHYFLEYSALEWVVHFRNMDMINDNTLELLSLKICDAGWKGHHTWFSIYRSTNQGELPESFTPLIVVSMLGLETLVRLLLKRSDVDINATDGAGRTALSWAAEMGWKRVVKVLLDENSRDNFVHHLVSEKVSVDLADKKGFTPLHYATKSLNESIVRLLLVTGNADVNMRTKDGETPLSFAILKGPDRVARSTIIGRHLFSTGKLDLKSEISICGLEMTPLHLAAWIGHEDFTKLLLNADHATPTGDTRKSSSSPVEGCRALKSGFLNASSETTNSSYDAATNLFPVIGKVDVNARDEMGRTPLSTAAERGHEGVVKFLLAIDRVDVNAMDDADRTPLHNAIINHHKGVVKLLLATDKVDVNAMDHADRTPLHYAVVYGVQSFLGLLFDTDKVLIDGRHPLLQTPLFTASDEADAIIVKLLLSTNKVEVDARDCHGMTPLHNAARIGHDSIVRLLLATNKVDVNVKDKEGKTALTLAAKNGHHGVVGDIVRLLRTARPNIIKRNG